MRRPTSISVAGFAGGVGLSVALAGGLVAVPDASVTSTGNRLSSASLTPGVLRAAAVDDPAMCVDAELSADTLPPLVLGEVDLADPGWRFDGPYLCVEHSAGRPATLLTSITSTIDVESGPCEPAEESAGDDSCGDEDAGELDDVIVLTIERAGAPGVCGDASAGFDQHRSGVVLSQRLPDGLRCAYQLTARVDHSVPSDVRVRAATDILGWEHHFVLRLGPPSRARDDTDGGGDG